MTTDEMVTKATKAARSMARRRPLGDDRYEVCDMVQDGCLAELQGRSAWYGVCDGLRSWLGRYGHLETMPLVEGLDSYYDPDPLRCLIAKERLDRHFEKLDRLKPKYRCAYMLVRHDGKALQEVAQILGCHYSRIPVLLHKAEKFVERVS